MALQIRNLLFDASDAGLLAELTQMLTNATAIGAVKKAPLARSHNSKYVYEIACQGMMIHLEVSADTAPGDITALEAVITGAVGVDGLVDNDVGSGAYWEIGHDDDLRVG